LGGFIGEPTNGENLDAIREFPQGAVEKKRKGFAQKKLLGFLDLRERFGTKSWGGGTCERGGESGPTIKEYMNGNGEKKGRR